MWVNVNPNCIAYALALDDFPIFNLLLMRNNMCPGIVALIDLLVTYLRNNRCKDSNYLRFASFYLKKFQNCH